MKSAVDRTVFDIVGQRMRASVFKERWPQNKWPFFFYHPISVPMYVYKLCVCMCVCVQIPHHPPPLFLPYFTFLLIYDTS